MGTRRLARGESQEVTRRALLRSAAVAGVASLVSPAIGRAAGAADRGAVFTTSLGGLRGTSAVIRPHRSFALAGLQWSHPTTAALELRAQAPDGRWSPWVTASTRGHDGDGQPAGEPFYGEPVWTGPAVAVQLRSDQLTSGVRVHFVSVQIPAGGLAAAAFPRATPVLEAGPGQPPILARGGWGAGQAHPVHIPEYGSIKLAFVHHTVNPNGYSAAAVPALLRGIFAYHVYVRGFWDIAYNFLIDAYGRIWEGRAGGIDMPVIGAHAGAYNAETTGVAILGDFMNVVPSPAAIGALEHLLAWKLSLHGLPSYGRATVVVDPAEAFYTPFRPGAHVSLPRVSGHRQGDLTDCPGNAFYARLPSIRPHVRALAGTPAHLSMSPGSVLITAGASAELSGTLQLLTGQPLGGAALELQAMYPTGPPAAALATLSTAADGTWSESVSLVENALVRAVHGEYPASVSEWAAVSVAPAVTLTVQSTSPLILSGTVSPAKAHVILELYRGPEPQGKPIKKKRVPAGTGSFQWQFATPGPGSYVVLARTIAGLKNVSGASPPVAITVS
ncbi:MAG TPA: N-acetylmuramoyl-L-alanine amidase [Solirubrobacteraceae bacterium]|nr:N-acetylmuramoyl-L-alanine amidase [Solirubrobacteraceae bacterium]